MNNSYNPWSIQVISFFIPTSPRSGTLRLEYCCKSSNTSLPDSSSICSCIVCFSKSFSTFQLMNFSLQFFLLLFLFCFVLFCFVLFCFVLFCFVLFCLFWVCGSDTFACKSMIVCLLLSLFFLDGFFNYWLQEWRTVCSFHFALRISATISLRVSVSDNFTSAMTHSWTK